jgi:hypothetical protein
VGEDCELDPLDYLSVRSEKAATEAAAAGRKSEPTKASVR